MSADTAEPTSSDDTPECRACLKKLQSEQLFNLFQAWTTACDGMNSTIAEDLIQLANVQVQETDRHSKVICGTCCSDLYNACKFKLLVQANNKILQQRYPETGSEGEKQWPLPIQVEKSVYNNPMEIEIKQEVMTDDENMCNGEEGYSTTPCVDMIKIEPEEIAEPVTRVPTSFLITEINGQECLEEQQYLQTTVKEEPLSETEDPEGAEDLSMECLLCARTFVSVTGLKAHVIAHHSYQTVERRAGNESPHRTQNNKYVCATCRRTFVTSTDLMVHETCHNKHVCYGCSASFDTFNQLTKHRRRCKALAKREVKKPKKLEDVQRPPQELVTEVKIEINSVTTLADSPVALSCPHCNQVFSDPYYMKIHQEVHYTNDEMMDTQNGSAPIEIEALENIFT